MEEEPTVIIRHRKENRAKCSLEPISGRSDCRFITYPSEGGYPSFENYVLLDFEGPVLTREDRHFGLLLLDGTWQYAERMKKDILSCCRPERRTLPSSLVTAYPRKQTGCLEPLRGLASIEALYAAYLLTGRDPKGLLTGYYFRELFLEKNRHFFSASPFF